MRTFIRLRVCRKQLGPGRQWREGIADVMDQESRKRFFLGLRVIFFQLDRWAVVMTCFGFLCASYSGDGSRSTTALGRANERVF